MPDPGVQPPYLDPSQYPGYLDLQRKQMLAQMLIQGTQQAAQTPPEWNSMRVVPRRSPLANIATLASALMAGKAVRGSQEAQQRYFQGLYGPPASSTAPGANAAPTPSLAPAPTDPAEQSVQPLIARNGQSLSQAIGAGAPSAPQAEAPNPLIPGGMSRGTASSLMSLMGPEKYAESLIAPQYKPTEMQQMLRAAGIDPDSALGRQVLQQALAKANYVAPVDIRPGGTALDPFTRQPVFSAPQGGIQTQYGPQGPVQSVVPGAAGAQAALAGATTGAQAANTPHYEPSPFLPGASNVSYPPTPPALRGPVPSPGAAAPSQTASARRATAAVAPRVANTAADLEQQKKGAESGQTYSDQLTKNAENATEVRRSLSELRNLANTAGVGVTNPAKLELGSYLIAAGMDPNKVGSMLGTDVGALTAATKQTGSLALDSIHSMTSRGTNFDLSTFMRYNPNLNMASPEGFNRVLDFMDKRMAQEVAKQADFDQWSQQHAPNRWASGHAAHWLAQQNQQISAGKANSRPPLSSFIRP